MLRATDPKLYVLKGGVNLRLHFQSPRYSKDMDLDVHAERVSVQTLKKNGYKLLEDAAFRRVLAVSGIAVLVVNDPAKAKHTSTTQRFRVGLVLDSGVRVPTKIEFSRRGIDEAQTVAERVDREVARSHGRTAYEVIHYHGHAAARQKVEALAGRPQTQARDLFDLAWLEARGHVDVALLGDLDPAIVRRASDALSSLGYAEWEGQVLEYLPEDSLADYEARDRFEGIQLAMIERLETSS